MKTILYRGTLVATNTDLYGLIDAKEHEKAKKAFKALEDKFMLDWPGGTRHLLNFKIGSTVNEPVQPTIPEAT